MISITERLTRSQPGWSTYLGLIAVLGCFCVPLFLGLRGQDLRNDEAIYSYAVDRILETGDWLTPRLIPNDGPFLEKPPLKFWIVAGAIRTGLMPHDEFGLRFIDAALAAVAFLYVFWLGRWLAGSLCGFAAVLVLFTFQPLLFETGLRGNYMEAALFLSYCGGIYHFARWAEGTAGRRSQLHAMGAGSYFAFGFMTKFVAVLFLPLVCAMAFAWRRDALARIRTSWRDWVVPILLIFVVIVPWFVYQAQRDGRFLWNTMFGEHILTRFTGVLDPRHQLPWHYYYSQTWRELTLAGTEWIATAGLVVLAVKALQGRPWLARLLVLWWLVPFALISGGTSKLFHYTYPFLPPVALGVGAAAAGFLTLLDRMARVAAERAATASSALERRVGGRAAGGVRSLLAFASNDSPGSRRLVRRLLLAGAFLAAALSVWTALAGPVSWKVDGVQLLRNSSVSRPILIAAILVGVAGYSRILIRGLGIAALSVVLPVMAYPARAERLTKVDHPLRTLRDCVLSVRESRPETHVFPPYGQLLSHSYNYYLRQVGPWLEHDRSPTIDELQLHLFASGQQALVIVSRSDYDSFRQEIASRDSRSIRLPPALIIQDDMVLVTPGPFAACGAAAVAAGGREAGEVQASREKGR